MSQYKYSYLIYYRGMTLIELMLALTLTLLILTGLSSVYLAIAKNHLAEAGLQNIQENARVTLQLLNSTLRLAGYIGCAKLEDDFGVASSVPDLITKKNRIQPYFSSEMKPGTDALTVRYANPASGVLTETMTQPSMIRVSASPKIVVGDRLLISNCQMADAIVIQQVSVASNGDQLLVSASPLSKLYQRNADVSKLEINTYFIGQTKRKDTHGHYIEALYKKDISGHKSELVEGVSALTIRYTVVENKKIMDLVADEVNDWSSVVGVSLQLEFSTLNNFLLKKTEYTYVRLREG
jgi:type IV pilus assembly protein PilW